MTQSVVKVLQLQAVQITSQTTIGLAGYYFWLYESMRLAVLRIWSPVQMDWCLCWLVFLSFAIYFIVVFVYNIILHNLMFCKLLKLTINYVGNFREHATGRTHSPCPKAIQEFLL